MSWLIGRWEEFWFEPRSPADLGFSRLVFFSTLLLFYWSYEPAAWSTAPALFWWPTPVFEALGLRPASATTLSILGILFKLALLASALGLFTRYSAVAAFVLGFYLLGLPHNFGKIHHGDAALVLVMGILAFSRCGDAWSLDRLWARRRGSEPTGESGEYTWPLKLVWTLFCLVFFAAGIAKLTVSGLSWITSDNLSLLLIRHHYTHHPPVRWGLFLAELGPTTNVIAATIICLELGAPLALLSKMTRVLFVGGLLLMQLGNAVLLGVPFHEFAALYVFWVPWGSLLFALRPVTCGFGFGRFGERGLCNHAQLSGHLSTSETRKKRYRIDGMA